MEFLILLDDYLIDLVIEFSHVLLILSYHRLFFKIHKSIHLIPIVLTHKSSFPNKIIQIIDHQYSLNSLNSCDLIYLDQQLTLKTLPNYPDYPNCQLSTVRFLYN